MVESHGDYRAEAWLEDHVGGPLYQNQTALPRLPVPSVADTLERFLPTALPLARTPEESASLQTAPLSEELCEPTDSITFEWRNSLMGIFEF